MAWFLAIFAFNRDPAREAKEIEKQAQSKRTKSQPQKPAATARGKFHFGLS
jgi:hypothetical protein